MGVPGVWRSQVWEFPGLGGPGVEDPQDLGVLEFGSPQGLGVPGVLGPWGLGVPGFQELHVWGPQFWGMLGWQFLGFEGCPDYGGSWSLGFQVWGS